jgi:hypothetical protein
MATTKTSRKDLNQLVFAILQQATGAVAPKLVDEKHTVRASKLSPEQRSDIAKNAAKKRWSVRRLEVGVAGRKHRRVVISTTQ